MSETKPNTEVKVFNLNMSEFEPLVTAAVTQMFSMMFGIQPRLKRSLEIHSKIGLSNYGAVRDISGTMSYVQENRVEGTMSIGFSRESSLAIFSKFYNEKLLTLDDPRVLSGVAEIANMMHGQLKDSLSRLGFVFSLTLPFVVLGTNHNIFVASNGKSFVYEYDINGENALVEIFVQTEK